MINIKSNEIHLWCAYDELIKDQDILQRYARMLNDEEKKQHSRFCFEKHRHQYLITRALVRTVLSSYINEVAPQQWEFKKNKYGKPFISNPLITVPLQFNISHTDKLIVLAVTIGQEIGVDAEYLLRSGDTIEIAERYFSNKEVQQLYTLSPENQKKHFYDLWTLSESYIKACGMGLSIPLNQFSLLFPNPGEITISFSKERNDQAEKWRFWQIQPNEMHRVALALKSNSSNCNYSINMRTSIPLLNSTEVNYPIIRKTYH